MEIIANQVPCAASTSDISVNATDGQEIDNASFRTGTGRLGQGVNGFPDLV